MSFLNRHFLDFSHLDKDDILFFFDTVKKISATSQKENKSKSSSKSVGLLFLENSTRTISSFELACWDNGYYPLKFDAESSSIKKGESILDTFLTLKSMGVDAIVVRHGFNFSLKDLAKNISIPIINAGEGASGHPSQALLDAYTILEEKGKIEGERVLIVGDVKFSRVAQSNLELLQKLGAEVSYCGPDMLLPQNSQKRFSSLDEGLSWATVVMALRPQLERHKDIHFESFRSSFIQEYSLTRQRIQKWNSNGIILHPGPFIREQEISSDVLQDPRCKVWKQVKNGRSIRRTLLGLILGDV